MRRALATVALAAAAPGIAPGAGAEAQRVDASRAGPPHAGELRVGDDVRAAPDTAPTTRVRGVVLRADSAGLTLAPRGHALPLTLAWAEVRQVERLAWRRPAGEAFVRGARWGALVGAATGVVGVGLAFRDERRSPCDGCFVGRPVVAAAGALMFTGVSTIVGGSVGLAFRDRWVRVRRP